MRYKFVRDPDHPLATTWGTVLEHRKILYDLIGPGAHRCHWCGTSIMWLKRQGGGKYVLTVDHVDGDPGNNDPANLVPACTPCNIRRGHKNAVNESEPHMTHPSRRGRVRAVELICAECGDQFLAPVAEANRRRFCSRPCMYAGRLKPR